MHDNRTAARDALAIVLEGLERSLEILADRPCGEGVSSGSQGLRAKLGDHGPMGYLLDEEGRYAALTGQRSVRDRPGRMGQRVRLPAVVQADRSG